MRLYHVSPSGNDDSIFAKGVDPSYSQGARKVCWFVSAGRLTWAIAHVSARHGFPVGEISVHECHLRPSRVKKSGLRGVYWTADVTQSNRIAPSTLFLKGVSDQ